MRRKEWINTDILGRTIFKIDSKEKNALTSLILRIKNSRFGILMTGRWVFPILIILLFYIISKITVFILEKGIKRLTKKSATDIDDRIIDTAKKPVKWIIIFFGINLALMSAKLSSDLSTLTGNLIGSGIIVLVFYIILRTVSMIIHSWGKKLTDKIDSRINDDLVPLFINFIKIIIVIIGLLMVLSKFEIEISPILASLGIAGFAIGFAIKDSLSNIIAGIVLILDQSFTVGDKVTIDDDTGIIKEVGLRNTKLMTFDNEIIVLPNGELMNKKFKNYVLPDPMIRVLVKFGVAYGSDVDKVEEIVLNALKKIEDICDDPGPAVVFVEMGDFSLNMQAKLWVPNYVNQYVKWLEATKAVYNSLNEANINIPFPTQTVYVQKD